MLFPLLAASLLLPQTEGLRTWDGKHSVDAIDVTLVYFVPRDRLPLPDWKDRAGYYGRRIERFHSREFDGRSVLRAILHPEPFFSARTTEQLREGDANAIYHRTLREVDAGLRFARGERKAFPILLVLSDINWRPLDDFHRLKTAEDGSWQFEGNYSRGRHHPGAASGGARAAYLSDRGIGWGLVSGDGWRVPYIGSDCVAYHEGVGHTIGLPHPEPANGSVMSLAQYRGWIHQSWIDDDQKIRLGWKPGPVPVDRKNGVFSSFLALPEPKVPKPGEAVELALSWPSGARLRSARLRYQTDLRGAWSEAPPIPAGPAPAKVVLGRFDRPTPVSYRIDVALEDGGDAELWGYFQVRSKAEEPPRPAALEAAAAPPAAPLPPSGPPVDLLALGHTPVSGPWTKEAAGLISPKAFGARAEIPYEPPAEYELSVQVEPLDAPGGLVLGQRSGGSRFLVLLNFPSKSGEPRSALEGVDGEGVDRNATTLSRTLFEAGRISQVICRVRKDRVTVLCDGREVIDWRGDPARLSLPNYWKTPREEALFLGAYDGRFRFHRATLVPLSGTGRDLR